MSADASGDDDDKVSCRMAAAGKVVMSSPDDGSSGVTGGVAVEVASSSLPVMDASCARITSRHTGTGSVMLFRIPSPGIPCATVRGPGIRKSGKGAVAVFFGDEERSVILLVAEAALDLKRLWQYFNSRQSVANEVLLLVACYSRQTERDVCAGQSHARERGG